MPTFTYPTAAELIQIAQDKMPALQKDRPIFEIMPITTADEALLMWEQKDNYTGLQQIRGIGGAPSKVNALGAKRYITQPGVYGEFKTIDETMLMMRRQIGTFGSPVNIDDLVVDAQEHLMQRRLDRIELIGWNILRGTYSVAGPNGAVMATDTYSVQTYSAGVVWGTAATATPLADFRAVQLKSRGHSVSFGATAKAYMNRTTYNQMVANTNAADIYGRRVAGLATANNLAGVNGILTGDGLPEIVIYDGGYIDDSGTFQLFIPNNRVIVVGDRPAGQVVAQYRMTRNVNNPDMAAGAYTRVIAEENVIPVKIDVHDGHNGGPVIYYPSAIVVMTV